MFALVNSSGTYTPVTLAAFFTGTNGAHPFGGLVADANGDLFGTTETGGPTHHNEGTVFEIANTGFFGLSPAPPAS